MTDKQIRKYINLLNKGKHEESIFTHKISENVEVAKVWKIQPNINDNYNSNFLSETFFFIKNTSNKYVGAVLDMGEDLHWYIIPKSRKQGHLTKSLKSAIIPYLFYFYEEYEFLKITIDVNIIGEINYQNSRKVAINLGFKSIEDSETEFELSRKDFNWGNENIIDYNSQINPERLELLKKRINYAYLLLYKCSDELLMKNNDDNELKTLAKKVKSYVFKI